MNAVVWCRVEGVVDQAHSAGAAQFKSMLVTRLKIQEKPLLWDFAGCMLRRRQPTKLLRRLVAVRTGASGPEMEISPEFSSRSASYGSGSLHLDAPCSCKLGCDSHRPNICEKGSTCSSAFFQHS